MKCDRVQELINEIPTSELRAVEHGVREHIDSCPACEAAYKLRLVAAESLAAVAGNARAADTFKKRVADMIREEVGERSVPTGERIPWWRAILRPSPAWAVIALVLFIASGFNYLRTMGYFAPKGEVPSDMAVFIDDVAHDAYLYARQSPALEALTSDPDAVRAWFAERVDFDVDVSAELASGYALEGVRLWHTVSRLSALIRYRTADGDWVALFLISAENLADRGGRVIHGDKREYHWDDAFGFTAVTWQEDAVGYALVADLEADRLIEMAEGFPR